MPRDSSFMEIQPLSQAEKNLAFYNSIAIIIPIGGLCFLGLCLMAVSVFVVPRDVPDGGSLGAFAFLLLIFSACIAQLFERSTMKEVFVSRLDRYTQVGHLSLYFDDYLPALSPLTGSEIRRQELYVGKQYRVHKIQGKSLIIALDLVEGPEV